MAEGVARVQVEGWSKIAEVSPGGVGSSWSFQGGDSSRTRYRGRIGRWIGSGAVALGALVAWCWWFGAVVESGSRDGQGRPGETASWRPCSQMKKGRIASIDLAAARERIAGKDYPNGFDDAGKGEDEGHSVDSWRTYAEVVETDDAESIGEDREGPSEEGEVQHSQGMLREACRFDKGDCEKKVRNEELFSSRRGRGLEGDVEKTKDGQKREREEAKVRRFFADPPWLRYSRLGSGSGMSSAFRKMNDGERKNEEEKVVLRSESWHTG